MNSAIVSYGPSLALIVDEQGSFPMAVVGCIPLVISSMFKKNCYIDEYAYSLNNVLTHIVHLALDYPMLYYTFYSKRVCRLSYNKKQKIKGKKIS